MLILFYTVLDSGIILISALAEEEDFTKYIPQPEFIDDYGKVSFNKYVHWLKISLKQSLNYIWNDFNKLPFHIVFSTVYNKMSNPQLNLKQMYSNFTSKPI